MPQGNYFAGYDPNVFGANYGRSASPEDKLGRSGLMALISSGGFAPGQREQLQAYANRELGARTNTERALAGERLAATPGARGTAFADAQYGQLASGQMNALQSYLGNIDQAGLDRQFNAISQLFGSEEASAQRRGAQKQQGLAGIASGLGGLGSLAGTLIASSEKFKKNISDADPTKLLAALKNLKLKKFNYKSEPEGSPKQLGLIAEDTPAPLSVAGKAIDINELVMLLLAAVQQLSKRQEMVKGKPKMKRLSDGSKMSMMMKAREEYA
jgi:hypothetical protein